MILLKDCGLSSTTEKEKRKPLFYFGVEVVHDAKVGVIFEHWVKFIIKWKEDGGSFVDRGNAFLQC